MEWRTRGRLSIAELQKGILVLKIWDLHALSWLGFCQQAGISCPIFPPDNPSLHKTCNQLSGYSEGTLRLSSNTVTSAHRGRAVGRRGGGGLEEEENPALLFSARTARSECVV